MILTNRPAIDGTDAPVHRYLLFAATGDLASVIGSILRAAILAREAQLTLVVSNFGISTAELPVQSLAHLLDVPAFMRTLDSLGVRFGCAVRRLTARQIESTESLPLGLQLQYLFPDIDRPCSVATARTGLQAFDFMSHVAIHIGDLTSELSVGCEYEELVRQLLAGVRFCAALQADASTVESTLRGVHSSGRWSAIHVLGITQQQRESVLRNVSLLDENAPLYVVCDDVHACESLLHDREWRGTRRVLLSNQRSVRVNHTAMAQAATDVLIALNADVFIGLAGEPFSELVSALRSLAQRNSVILPRIVRSVQVLLHCFHRLTNADAMQLSADQRALPATGMKCSGGLMGLFQGLSLDQEAARQGVDPQVAMVCCSILTYLPILTCL